MKVEKRIVLGSAEGVAAALAEGSTAETINVSYVERSHATQRHFNARKARKGYSFSKEWSFHLAVTWLCVVFYNFGWTVRTLRELIQEKPPRYHYRTPAMVAGLTDHVWTLEEILTRPLYAPKPPAAAKKRQRKSKEPDG